jgi:hypothetical protein
MTDDITHDQLVAALKQLNDAEARQVFDEARGQDGSSKKQHAAQAMQQYLHGARS